MPLQRLVESLPRRQAATLLPKDPHGNRHEHDEDVQPANRRKHLQRAHAADPVRDEIIHSKRVNVSQIQRRKRLWRLGPMALGNVPEDPVHVSKQTRMRTRSDGRTRR